MKIERHVKVFRNGRNKAVRFPREFEPAGDEVVMRKEGDTIVIEPKQKKSSLLEWLATLEPFNDEFPEVSDPPTEPEDIF
jgi:antitoxin VapB